MNVDVSEFLNALGGGMGGAVILASWGIIVAMWRRQSTLESKLDASHEARIEDQQTHTEQLIENMRMLDRAVQFLERRDRG